MGIASPGVGSSLDVNGIISQLMQIEQRPLLILDQKEAGLQAKLSALGTLKSALSTFQSAMDDLSGLSKFQTLTAVSSSQTTFTASADATANAGSYAIEITQIAQQQKLAAAGKTSTTDAIGTGTITFDFGTISGGTFDTNTGKYTGATFTSSGTGSKTVTIDSTNNSLEGIKNAINAAKIGVTATIVNDGSASPYRLSLTSDTLGKKNSMKIAVSGDAALSSLLAHDPAGTQNLAEVATARDAALKVDGIAVTKTSNTVTDVIQGVTLNLLTTNSGAPATLTLSEDTGEVTDSVNAFVDAFNTADAAINDLIAYDPETQEGGLLLGDTSVLSVQNRIHRILTAAVPGLTGTYTNLSDIGVAFQKDGTLAVDAVKLQDAVTKNFKEIAGLFTALGTPSDSLVRYSSASDKTKPGSYAVSVTTLATQGKSVGSASAGLTITAGVNDTLNVTVDGGSATVTLAAGTYATADLLAAEVQSKINGASAFSSAGISVTVTQSSGVFTITSAGYGSASKVNITGGNGKTNLMGASPTETQGLDVAGTINNASATGFGQFLTASAGSDAEGLKLQIVGGATGSRGTVNYSEGYAFQLKEVVDDLLGDDGPIFSRTDGINRRIDDIQDRRDILNKRIAGIEERYRAQFTSLDILLSNMQSTSDFLSQQITVLARGVNFNQSR